MHAMSGCFVAAEGRSGYEGSNPAFDGVPGDAEMRCDMCRIILSLYMPRMVELAFCVRSSTVGAALSFFAIAGTPEKTFISISLLKFVVKRENG